MLAETIITSSSSSFIIGYGCLKTSGVCVSDKSITCGATTIGLRMCLRSPVIWAI